MNVGTYVSNALENRIIASRNVYTNTNPRILHPFLFVLLGFLVSSLSSVHASSPPADSLHFCAFDDHEYLLRDHTLPAAKRPANLNVGEPRTVRMIYFLPNDRPFRQEVVDSMKVTIREVQAFFAEQMASHGYGYRTFRYEADADGEPLVHRVDGDHGDAYYLQDTWDAYWEYRDAYVVREMAHLFAIDNSTNYIHAPNDGAYLGRGTETAIGGEALVGAGFFYIGRT